MPVAIAYTVWWKASIAISCCGQNTIGGAMSSAGSVTWALPQIAAPWAAVAFARRQAGGVEQAANDPPAGAVAPVREVVEARLGDGVLELGDAERLGGGARRRGAGRAPPQLGLQRARDGHRGGAGEAGDEALADAACDLLCGLHE